MPLKKKRRKRKERKQTLGRLYLPTVQSTDLKCSVCCCTAHSCTRIMKLMIMTTTKASNDRISVICRFKKIPVQFKHSIQLLLLFTLLIYNYHHNIQYYQYCFLFLFSFTFLCTTNYKIFMKLIPFPFLFFYFTLLFCVYEYTRSH